MPRIFDNIDQKLLPTLRDTLELSNHANFCVGYFNLRGWKQLDQNIENRFVQPENQNATPMRLVEDPSGPLSITDTGHDASAKAEGCGGVG